MHGTFIVIEGPDGSGTTTHTDFLVERLIAEGKDVLLTREPSESPIGKDIRRYLSEGNIPHDALQLLFTADRAWHLQNVILPSLEAGKTVVCEQYALSTYMFGSAAGISLDWLKSINSSFIEPNTLIVLLPPFEVCIQRLRERDSRDMLEGEQFLRKVYDNYKEYCTAHQLTVIDSSLPKQEAADAVYNATI